MKPARPEGHLGKHLARPLFMRRGSNMDEAKTFRRAVAVGLLTLGVGLGGQMASSRLETTQARVCTLSRPAPDYSLYARFAPRASGSIAQRVARAVIGAVLSSFV